MHRHLTRTRPRREYRCMVVRQARFIRKCHGQPIPLVNSADGARSDPAVVRVLGLCGRQYGLARRHRGLLRSQPTASARWLGPAVLACMRLLVVEGEAAAAAALQSGQSAAAVEAADCPLGDPGLCHRTELVAPDQLVFPTLIRESWIAGHSSTGCEPPIFSRPGLQPGAEQLPDVRWRGTFRLRLRKIP